MMANPDEQICATKIACANEHADLAEEKRLLKLFMAHAPENTRSPISDPKWFAADYCPHCSGEAARAFLSRSDPNAK